jgi:hypothetical protein
MQHMLDAARKAIRITATPLGTTFAASGGRVESWGRHRP